MLYYVYKLNDDDSKDRLHITNSLEVAEQVKAYHEIIQEVSVMIEIECPHCETSIPVKGKSCVRVECPTCKTIVAGCHK